MVPSGALPGPALDFVGDDTLLLDFHGGDDHATDRALIPRSAAARAALFTTPPWLAALQSVGLTHFDASNAALAPGLGFLTAAGEPPLECRVPSLVCIVLQLTRTSCGDTSALLADPTGEADALLVGDAAADLRVGTAVHLRGVSVLVPSFAPRVLCLLVTKQHVVHAWHPQPPMAPVSMPPPMAPAVPSSMAAPSTSMHQQAPMPPPPRMPPVMAGAAPSIHAQHAPIPTATCDLSALDVDDSDLL
jgi:hypothetical protein